MNAGAIEPPTAAIPRRLLAAFYLVVPLAIGGALLDGLVLGGSMRAGLPLVPDELPYWTLLFNVPHVVASVLLLADREYLVYYRWHIAGALGGVAALTLLHASASMNVTMWIAAAILSYHLVGQQVGIAKMLGGCTSSLMTAWKGIGAALLLLATASQLDVMHLPEGFVLDEHQLGALLCLPLLYLGLRVWQKSKPGLGRLYVLGNQLMFLAFVPLAQTGYFFMAAVMIRVVHDLTAFSFYIVHDRNRHRTEDKNSLYRVFSVTRLPHWALLLGVSIGLGHLLTRIEPSELMHPVAMISMFHYCMEAMTWRRTGLHRRAVSIA